VSNAGDEGPSLEDLNLCGAQPQSLRLKPKPGKEGINIKCKHDPAPDWARVFVHEVDILEKHGKIQADQWHPSADFPSHSGWDVPAAHLLPGYRKRSTKPSRCSCQKKSLDLTWPWCCFFRWEVSWGCIKILGKQPNPVVKDDFPKCYDNLGYIGIPWHTLFLDTTSYIIF